MKVAGLVCVFAGQRVYLGKLLKEENGRVVLGKTVELLIRHAPTPSGAFGASVMPIPITPTEDFCTVTAWPDALVDMSEDLSMGQLYSQVTGASGLVVPVPTGLPPLPTLR
jgi:hypothetical protein